MDVVARTHETEVLIWMGEDWDANFIAQCNLLMVMMLMKVVMKMIWMWMKSLCLSLSEVIMELDEIKLFF